MREDIEKMLGCGFWLRATSPTSEQPRRGSRARSDVPGLCHRLSWGNQPGTCEKAESSVPLLENPTLLELLHLFRCITQDLGVDLLVVLTEHRCSRYLDW